MPRFPAATYRLLVNNNEGLSNDDLWQARRTFVSSWAKSDERGSTGIRTINLNDYVALTTDYTTPDGQDEIARHVVALGDFMNLALPDWGKRSSTDAAVPEADKRRYCVQIAANIQDYIDKDHQPTVIRHNLDDALWERPPDPSEIGEGAPTQPPAAFGKEVVPNVVEYAGFYYPDNSALRVDHAFEVLNLYTKPIDLAHLDHPRILMAEREIVTPNTGSDAPVPVMLGTPGQRPLVFDLPLTSGHAELPAGAYAVYSTLPSAADPVLTRWFSPDANRIPLARKEGTFAYGNKGLRMEGDGTAIAADVNTEIVVFNDYGYLDIQPRVAQQGVAIFHNGTVNERKRVIASQPFGNAGSSSGNNSDRKYPLDSGDPRSLTDVYPTYSESSGNISMLAWRRNAANSPGFTDLGADSNNGSAGFIPDNSGKEESRVPEPLIAMSNGKVRPMAILRDGPMRTIGELGFIYDPAIPGPSLYTQGSISTRQRAGFRTLDIGTDWGEQKNDSDQDFRQLQQTAPKYAEGKKLSALRAYRLLDIFDAQSDRNGRILLNSVLRDPRNFPLRAVFYALKTQTNTTVSLDGKGDYAGPKDPTLTAGKAVNIDQIILSLRNRMLETDKPESGPFLTLGQLGDLDLFNKGTELLGQDLTPDTDNKNHGDSGREEILRNSFELLTLKGAVYTVYVIAQSGADINEEFVPRSTTRLIRTVELQRSYPDLPFASFHTSATTSKLLENNKPILGRTRAVQLFNERY